MAIAATFAFGACKNKAENPTPTTGKATIAGFATVDLDLTQAGYQGAIPAGTKVVVVVNTQDLAVAPLGANFARRAYEATIGTDGTFSVEIDAVAKPMNVEIRPDGFDAQQVIAAGPPIVSERKAFAVNSGNAINVTIAKGQKVVRNLAYAAL